MQPKENDMQLIAEIMTRDVTSISPQENLRRAAQMMADLDVGAIPVCEGEKLLGVMTPDVSWCFDDQPVDEVMEQMQDAQIRRVPVLDHDSQRLVGIVSLGDL